MRSIAVISDNLDFVTSGRQKLLSTGLGTAGGGELTSRRVSDVDAIADWLSVLPAQMRDPVLFAIPFFLLLLVLEWTAARKLERIESAGKAAVTSQRARPVSGAYLARDSWASIWMGLVSVATTAAWKFVALLGYAAIYAYLAPWHLSATRWYTWLVAILGVDLLYYSYHRMAHRVRLIWATHQAHHSSQYFNFATALRQKWNNSGEIRLKSSQQPVPDDQDAAIVLVEIFRVHAMMHPVMGRGVEDEFERPPHLVDPFGVHPELVDEVHRKARKDHLGGIPKSGKGIHIRISPLLFHFCRSAVAKLKYWLE